MKTQYLLLFLSIILLGSCHTSPDKNNNIIISFSESISSETLDGRLLLMLSTNNEKEPRFQINSGLTTQLIYGVDVENMKAGEEISFNNSVFGFPYLSLNDVPPGDYYVQALLHVYETFNLETGHTVKLPMDNGEGQQWNRSPGNLYSCLLYTSPSPRDKRQSRMPSSA